MAQNHGLAGYLGDLDVASQRIPPDEPYIMMNMMNFRPTAQYPPSSTAPGPALLSGIEAYALYRDSFLRRVKELGLNAPEVFFLGKAHTNIIAGPHEGESWDLVLMIRFENFANLRTVLDDDVYVKTIQPHRLAATKDFKSFAVTQHKPQPK